MSHLILTLVSENTENASSQLRQLVKDTSLLRTERHEQFDRLSLSLRDIHSEIRSIETKVIPNDDGITRGYTSKEMEVLTTKVSALSIQEREFAHEEFVLSGLNFEQRPERHNSIPKAHMRTFNWLFDASSDDDSSQRRFVEWLKGGEGVYWISGKPGSGKSTLMKFACQHRSTMEHLSTWAKGERVVVACHFFWSAGSPMQRSREGLMRSLLYDILSQLPKLIPVICPRKWAQPKDISSRQDRWSLEELQDTLKGLQTQKELPLKFCFFIDGLDEFEGDSIDICRALVDLCASSYIKICISSRPWDVFENCLGQNSTKKLFVHHLTQDDIRNYVKSELQGHSNWNLTTTESNQVPILIQEITSRAQGVFLWVFLVVRLLRDGLMNDDSLEDLRMRLNTIPTDLERFFKQILESVEPFYHQKQSRTLQMALAAEEPLHLNTYSFHDLECHHEDYALGNCIKVFEKEEYTKFHALTAKRLNRRCKGLLEIRNHKVEFLHRTVRDFLHSSEMAEFLRSRTSSSFNPNLSIVRAHIAWIKTTRFTDDYTNPEINRDSFRGRLSQILDSAIIGEAKEARQQMATAELEDLEWSLEMMVQQGQLASPKGSFTSGTDEFDVTEGIRSLFRTAILEKNLVGFVSRKLDQEPDYFCELEKGPLLLALETYAPESEVAPIFPDSPRPDASPKDPLLVQLLLERGFDPNKVLLLHLHNGETSPWTEFMSLMTPWHRNSDLAQPVKSTVQSCFLHTLKTGIFTLLLRHGANPNSCLPNWYKLNKPENTRDKYGSPNIAVIWVLLGLAIEDTWKHSQIFLRDLKAMISAHADFSGLNSGGPFEIKKNEKYLTAFDESESDSESNKTPADFGMNEDGAMNIGEERNVTSRRRPVKKFESKAEWKTRWGILVELLTKDAIPEKQLFQARIMVEVAKADSKKRLPWSMLGEESSLKRKFPRHLMQAILSAT